MKNKIEVIASRRGFTVSEEGLLYNPKGEQVGNYVDSNGYFNANLRTKKRNTNMLKVHRLQAYQKYGNKLFEEGIQVRHLDGNKENNTWNNIAIGTQSENQMDIPKQIRIKRALTASSNIRKYNKEEVKKFHRVSKSYKRTMEKFNISSKGTLNYILNN